MVPRMCMGPITAAKHVHADGTVHEHHDAGAPDQHSDLDGKAPAGNGCGVLCVTALPHVDDGMTMVFRAADTAMLKSVKAGKVKFVPEHINGQFTVTRIEKAR
jgi:hypothetical protein